VIGELFSGTASRAGLSYVENNPATHADPGGHCIVDIAADVFFIGFDLFTLVFGPEKDRGINGTALGADAVAALIPCVSGAGIIVRIGSVASRVVPDLAGATAKIIRQRSYAAG
jgi:hypothetical protein